MGKVALYTVVSISYKRTVVGKFVKTGNGPYVCHIGVPIERDC